MGSVKYEQPRYTSNTEHSSLKTKRTTPQKGAGKSAILHASTRWTFKGLYNIGLLSSHPSIDRR